MSETEPMTERQLPPLCAICGERTNRRVYQDCDPQSPTYQEYSTTCSHTCRELERRAVQEVEVMARVHRLAEQRAAEEMSTVSGESSEGGQNRSYGSESRHSRPWRMDRRMSYRTSPSVAHSSKGHRDSDSRRKGGTDGGSSSSSQPSSRRSTRSQPPDPAIAQALLQATQALTANQLLCSQLQQDLSNLRANNQTLMESNQVNQANNALLMSRLQVLEQGVISTPMGSSSGIGRLTPQAPPSAAMNHTAVVTPLESGTVKRMRVRELDAPSRPSDSPSLETRNSLATLRSKRISDFRSGGGTADHLTGSLLTN